LLLFIETSNVYDRHVCLLSLIDSIIDSSFA